MKRIEFGDVSYLQHHQPSIAVSLYIPTKAGAPASHENTVTFKTQLKKARHWLRATPRLRPKMMKIFASMMDKLPEITSEANDGGVAVFADTKHVSAFSLHHRPQPRITIGQYFNIDQLSQDMAGVVHYFVLELNQKLPRLFEITEDYIKARPFIHQAKDLWTELRLDEVLDSMQTHPAVRYGNSEIESPHGHGGYKDTKPSLIEHYLRRIDDHVKETIDAGTTPLILAGVQRITSSFQKLSHYPNIYSRSLTGNFQTATPKTIKEISMPLWHDFKEQSYAVSKS